MGNNPNSLCPRCKEREESHPHFIFHCRLSQITLDFINKLINLSYTFRTPFNFSIKDILMATSSHTHDGVKLEILQTIIEVFLVHITFCRRKVFYGDGCDKIQELSNCKGNLVSHFKKPRAMSVELGSKKSFLRKWSSLLNTNAPWTVSSTVLENFWWSILIGVLKFDPKNQKEKSKKAQQEATPFPKALGCFLICLVLPFESWVN